VVVFSFPKGIIILPGKNLLLATIPGIVKIASLVHEKEMRTTNGVVAQGCIMELKTKAMPLEMFWEVNEWD
jgi:hypothetical protein